MRLGDLDLLNRYRTKEDGKHWWGDYRNDTIEFLLEKIPEINVETLPIVIELRNKLSEIQKEKDDALELLHAYRHVCMGMTPKEVGEAIEEYKSKIGDK